MIKDVNYWSVKSFIRELERRDGTDEVLRILRFWVNKLVEENAQWT